MANDSATIPEPVQEPVASTTFGGTATDSSDPSNDGQSSGILPEKFRGPDGIALMTKAYTEAERELRSAQERAAKAEKEAERAKLLDAQIALAQAQAAQASQPVHSVNAPNEDETYLQEWEQDPARAALNRIKTAERRNAAVIQGSAQKAAYDAMKSDPKTYPDFANYEPEMIQVAQQYGSLLRSEELTNPNLIPLLYNIVQARHLPEKVKMATEKATSEAQSARARKNAAQAEGGNTSSAGNGGAASFSDLSLKEMENLLGFVDR